jgi:hypothetical protein
MLDIADTDFSEQLVLEVSHLLASPLRDYEGISVSYFACY